MNIKTVSSWDSVGQKTRGEEHMVLIARLRVRRRHFRLRRSSTGLWQRLLSVWGPGPNSRRTVTDGKGTVQWDDMSRGQRDRKDGIRRKRTYGSLTSCRSIPVSVFRITRREIGLVNGTGEFRNGTVMEEPETRRGLHRQMSWLSKDVRGLRPMKGGLVLCRTRSKKKQWRVRYGSRT